MNSNYDGAKKKPDEDRTIIKTGGSTYSFTQSWVENEALKDILVGLIADDYNGLRKS